LTSQNQFKGIIQDNLGIKSSSLAHIGFYDSSRIKKAFFPRTERRHMTFTHIQLPSKPLGSS